MNKNPKEVKLQITTFKADKMRIRCNTHGIQKMISIPKPTPKEVGGVVCRKCYTK